MLPVLAVIFAVVGAVGGDFLPITQGYYKVTSTSCSTSTLSLNQQDCFVSQDTQYPICTVTSGGAKPAFEDENCANALRHNP